MKRFFREVTVQEVVGGWQVALDGRPVMTQQGSPQLLASRQLGEILAAEWAGLGQEFGPSDLPQRDLADMAIDLIAPARSKAIAKLLSYIDTDTLCYQAQPDEPLAHRQREVWEPILCRFEARECVTLQRVHGIVHKPHPEASMKRLREQLGALDDFTLAGLTAMASLAASLCIAVEANQPAADGEALWNAANLEEDWQVEQWGEDTQAAARRERRKGEFLKALEFAKAARA